jgi:signal transduction protein with GAF and PtsI domain
MATQAISTEPTPPDKRKAYRRHEDRQLRQRERELEAARRICQELSRHLNVDELVKRALKTALEVVNAEAGSVLLADAEAKILVFRYIIGEKADMLTGKAMPWDHGLAGAIFHSGEPEVITDVKQDKRHLPDIDNMTGYRTRDMIVLPLKQWEGEPIGVLQVMNKRDRRFNTEDLSILTIISAVTSMVIEQAWLFEKAKLAEVVRLLGDMGHDLKNLLQPVIGGAWLLKNDLDDLFNSLEGKIDSGKIEANKLPNSHKRCNEVVEMLGTAGRRIQDRVREIADCVRGLSSPPHFAPCKLADVVDSVLQTMYWYPRQSVHESGH